MTASTEHMEVKKKIERLGMLLVEHSEKVAQLCITEDSVQDLNEILTIIPEKLNTQKS